jgi:hypothetical protein
MDTTNNEADEVLMPLNPNNATSSDGDGGENDAEGENGDVKQALRKDYPRDDDEQNGTLVNGNHVGDNKGGEEKNGGENGVAENGEEKDEADEKEPEKEVDAGQNNPERRKSEGATQVSRFEVEKVNPADIGLEDEDGGGGGVRKPPKTRFALDVLEIEPPDSSRHNANHGVTIHINDDNDGT